jgi:hypothetical protein
MARLLAKAHKRSRDYLAWDVVLPGVPGWGDTQIGILRRKRGVEREWYAQLFFTLTDCGNGYEHTRLSFYDVDMQEAINHMVLAYRSQIEDDLAAAQNALDAFDAALVALEQDDEPISSPGPVET